MKELVKIEEVIIENQDSIVVRKPGIEDLFDRFIAYVDGAETTVESYTKALRQFFKWLESKNIKSPEREDVINYRNYLRDEYKAGTVHVYMVAVRLFFKWTEEEKLYPNIADKIKGPKLDKRHKKDPLTSKQAKDVIAGIDESKLEGLRNKAMIAIAVTGGLRVIEIKRANIEDLNEVSGQRVLYIQGKGKDDKAEYVKIVGQVGEILDEYLKARGRYSPKDPLFASVGNRNRGGRMVERSISRIIKNSMRDVGIDNPRITAHSLRHTAATINLLNGGTESETQQLLRHDSITTTMIYSHHLSRIKNKGEERIADSIFLKEEDNED